MKAKSLSLFGCQLICDGFILLAVNESLFYNLKTDSSITSFSNSWMLVFIFDLSILWEDNFEKDLSQKAIIKFEL